MRRRHLFVFLAVIVAASLVSGCSPRALTKGENDQVAAISGKIAKAESWGAKTCAPKELANAQADLAAARHEATENWETPEVFFGKANKSADVLLAKAETCLTPVVSFSAEPATVAPGQCATLRWNTQYVKKAEIEGMGDVPASGSKQVCPSETTQYGLTAQGPGGTVYEFATVAVVAPPPPPPPPPAPVPVPVVTPAPAKISLHVNFDTNKYTIRPADLAELQKAIQFVKDHPGSKIQLVGYTDSRGTDAYNLKLSEKRAEAVKKYIEGEVSIAPENITAVGKGKADPIGDNKTKEGQFQNRRVEISADAK
jgi:outer membrane protein OmpA-like peptidoglycan-associated protein